IGKQHCRRAQIRLQGIGSWLRLGSSGGQRSTATATEAFARVVRESASRAGRRQSRAAGAAESPTLSILGLTVRAPHVVGCCPGPRELTRSGAGIAPYTPALRIGHLARIAPPVSSRISAGVSLRAC